MATLIIGQICNVKPRDTATVRSTELLAQSGIEDLDLSLKERRLCWYGHVECSTDAVKTAFDIQVDGECGPERPKITWGQLTERDCREWNLWLSTLMIGTWIYGVDLPCVQQAS